MFVLSERWQNEFGVFFSVNTKDKEDKALYPLLIISRK